MEGEYRHEIVTPVMSTELQRNVPLEMYTLPSQTLPITKHAYKRYINCHEQNSLIEGYVSNSSEINVATIVFRIKNASGVEKISLMEEAFSIDNHLVQEEVVPLIFTLPKPERHLLDDKVDKIVGNYLSSDDLDVKRVGAWLIGYTSEKRRSFFRKKVTKIIDNTFDGDDVEAKRVAVRMLSSASPSKMGLLIDKALEIDDDEVKKEAIKRIKYVPDSGKKALIEKALDIDNIEIIVEAAEMIGYAVEADQEPLKIKLNEKIKSYFDSDDIKILEKVSDLSRHVPETDSIILRNKIAEKIEIFLSKGDIETKRIATKIIIDASESKRGFLIHTALGIKDTEIRKTAASIIYLASDIEKGPLIAEALRTNDVEVQAATVLMINSLNANSRDTFLRWILKIDNSKVQKALLGSVRNFPKEEKEYIFGLILSKHPSEMIIQSPLYKDGISDIYPERKPFAKTGSETTLIGGELKGKSIIRHIQPEAFLAWQKIYENYQTWEEAGFDYVPIEPIQAYRFDEEKKLVDVFSGVLDLSFIDWRTMTSMFEAELYSQKSKIEEVLATNKVMHGHLHDNNFVLSFFRNEDGSVNFNKVPRLYVIDFDQAVSFQ